MADTRRHAVGPIRWWGVLLLAGGAVTAVAAVAAVVITLRLARMVVTPPAPRKDDVRVLSVSPSGSTITMASTPESRLPGEYGFWFSGDRGYARVGDILKSDQLTVTRAVLVTAFGELAVARAGRFSGWVFRSPGELGFPFEEVQVPTSLGPAPAWLVPAEEPTDRWVIQVHGRAVRREETIRALPVFREAGYTSLLVSYRNDGDAPVSLDGRYGLGDTEWNDIADAMRFAVDRGAREIVLMGWSMGGATVLQALTRSPLAPLVTGVVLDSPVIDWRTALRYQADLYRLPGPISSAVLEVIGKKWGMRLTGQSAPIDLERLDFVSRSADLNVPILLMHSDDDGYVPATASKALAAARPDIVTFDSWTGAAHTKLWNYDRERWNSTIRLWLSKLR